MLKAVHRIIKRGSDEWNSEAVRLLGEINFDGALESILLLSRNHDIGLRQGAVKALSYLSGDVATDRLIELTEDVAGSVREAAIKIWQPKPALE
ncbi:HEAT repeat domain-containing protein [Pseudomonas sp. GZD-222]|uniref:HEAT repeat domain-containing protein n=1 Tax=Pseudomonas sp. GZD-222 TaxID=3404805 RepID=UPI003BB7A576